MSRSDKEIERAIKRRIIEEINSRSSGSVVNNNNNYGSSHSPSKGEAATLSERMLSGDDDPFDYKVMIARKDSDEINKATKKPDGWAKQVHRYRTKKGEDDPYEGLLDRLKKKGGTRN